MDYEARIGLIHYDILFVQHTCGIVLRHSGREGLV